MFWILKAIAPFEASDKNKIAAFIVRMISNGDIGLLNDDENVVKIINAPSAELPSSSSDSYEYVYHILHSILWTISNEDDVVYFDMIKGYDFNPFDKKVDSSEYKTFENNCAMITNRPRIKRSMISREEAVSVMGLKKYLEEKIIDYNQSTTNGIPSIEYLVYECLFGITKHSNLNFYKAAFAFSDAWSMRLQNKESESSILDGVILGDFGGGSSGGFGGGSSGGFGGGSFGGGGAGGRW